MSPQPTNGPTAARGVRRYFVWSPALDPEARAAAFVRQGGGAFRLPPGAVAEALDVDLVYSHPSTRWGGRVAGLLPRPGASVFGLLFEVPEADFRAVEEAEGVPSGEAVAKELQVRSEGRTVTATAFTPRPEGATREGPVSQRYADALARGAEKAGLPGTYVTKLQAEAMLLERVQSFGERMGLVSP